MGEVVAFPDPNDAELHWRNFSRFIAEQLVETFDMAPERVVTIIDLLRDLHAYYSRGARESDESNGPAPDLVRANRWWAFMTAGLMIEIALREAKLLDLAVKE